MSTGDPKTPAEKLAEIKRGAAAHAKDKIKALLVSEGKPLLIGCLVFYCVHTHDNRAIRVDLPGLILHPVKDYSPIAAIHTLAEDGMSYGSLCTKALCSKNPRRNRVSHRSVTELKEYTAEDYYNLSSALLSEIESLKQMYLSEKASS